MSSRGLWLSLQPPQEALRTARSLRPPAGGRRTLNIRLARTRGWFVLAAACLAAALPARAPAQAAATLLELSIEELGELRVVSVSRREEALEDAPAAVYAITHAEIRRSGVQSIAEALRLAPGLEVARGGAGFWNISMRGFNSNLANKLLVLIDGRSVYTPLYGGVFWDTQDVLLEDIDRIEVIAGPGGTMWGANAVNGVINVITRPAWDTQGGYLELGGGNQRQGTALRYGGTFGESGAVRGYLKHFERDASRRATGGSALDDWEMTQGGFRSDWRLLRGSVTVQGDVYSGKRSELLRGPFTLGALPEMEVSGTIDFSGTNLRTHWERVLANGGAVDAFAYYARTERDVPHAYSEQRDTLTAGAQHRLPTRGRHELLWGATLLRTGDRLGVTTFSSFHPPSRTDRTYSLFVQDKIDVWSGRLFLTLGSKLEHNDYTGVEYQPNVRVSWHIDERSTLWAAASRAVRIPARLEHDAEIFLPMPVLGSDPPFYSHVTGDEDVAPERLVAYELGYRTRLGTDWSIDAVVFEHRYDDLRASVTGEPLIVPGPPPYGLLPVEFTNDLEGETYGGTVAVRWQPAARWQLSAHYSRLLFDLRLQPGRSGPNALDIAGNSPSAQLGLHAFAELPLGFSFYAGARYVDELPSQRVPSYTALDVSLGWRPTERIKTSLVGQNLTDAQHPEFGSRNEIEQVGTGNEIERTFYMKLEWTF